MLNTHYRIVSYRKKKTENVSGSPAVGCDTAKSGITVESESAGRSRFLITLWLLSEICHFLKLNRRPSKFDVNRFQRSDLRKYDAV